MSPLLNAPDLEKFLFHFGINRQAGVESFRDTADCTVVWRASRCLVNDYDVDRLSMWSSEFLDECMAGNLFRVSKRLFGLVVEINYLYYCICLSFERWSGVVKTGS